MEHAERMAHFVIGDAAALSRCQNPALLFKTGKIRSIAFVTSSNVTCALSRRVATNRRFIHKIGDISAREPRRHGSDTIEIDFGIEDDFFGMHVQNFEPTLAIRTVDKHLAVEAAGAEQGRSRISGRFVAASNMTPVEWSKPSSSARS